MDNLLRRCGDSSLSTFTDAAVAKQIDPEGRVRRNSSSWPRLRKLPSLYHWTRDRGKV